MSICLLLPSELLLLGHTRKGPVPLRLRLAGTPCLAPGPPRVQPQADVCLHSGSEPTTLLSQPRTPPPLFLPSKQITCLIASPETPPIIPLASTTISPSLRGSKVRRPTRAPDPSPSFPGTQLHEPSSSSTYLRCSALTLSVFICSSPPNPPKKWNKSSITVFE